MFPQILGVDPQTGTAPPVPRHAARSGPLLSALRAPTATKLQTVPLPPDTAIRLAGLCNGESFQECVSGPHIYSNMLAVGSEKADGALIAPHENLEARQAVSVEV